MRTGQKKKLRANRRKKPEVVVVAAPPPPRPPRDMADEAVPPPAAAWAQSKKLCRFIVQLAHHGNVTKALRGADLSRVYAYDRKGTDLEFAAAWDDAVKMGLQVLKDEAWRRAHEGVERDKFYQGRIVGREREYSDTLLMFLIKQHDPSYREHFDVNLGNAGGRPFMFQMLLNPAAAKAAQTEQGRK